MNITNNIIQDLLPLYAAGECSADTRALVEEFLRQNPRQAEQLRQLQDFALPSGVRSAAAHGEMRAFRKSRQLLQLRSWLLGLGIFFSLAPFSFFIGDQHNFWMLRDAPHAALAYAALGAACWIGYGFVRRRSRGC